MPSERLFARAERWRGRHCSGTFGFSFSVGSESLCSSVVTANAGHRAIPLVFLREKPDNQGLGSRCGLRPPLDLALLLAETNGGAFLLFFLFHCLYWFRWIAIYHRTRWRPVRPAQYSSQGTQFGERFRRRRQSNYSAICGLSVFCFNIKFLVIVHSLESSVTCRERIAELVKIELRPLQKHHGLPRRSFSSDMRESGLLESSL